MEKNKSQSSKKFRREHLLILAKRVMGVI